MYEMTKYDKIMQDYPWKILAFHIALIVFVPFKQHLKNGHSIQLPGLGVHKSINEIGLFLGAR